MSYSVFYNMLICHIFVCYTSIPVTGTFKAVGGIQYLVIG